VECLFQNGVKVQSLEHNVEILTQAVLHAAKQCFGASSEKIAQIYGQCFIFDELIDENSDKTENKLVNIKEQKRPVMKKVTEMEPMQNHVQTVK